MTQTTEHDALLNSPVRDFAVVHVRIGSSYREASIQTYMVHGRQVDGFVQSLLELHHEPGLNPFTERPETPIWEIMRAPLSAVGPYWWSTPGLGAEDDTAHRSTACTNGTILIDTEAHQSLVWRHPDIRAMFDEDEEERLRIERDS